MPVSAAFTSRTSLTLNQFDTVFLNLIDEGIDWFEAIRAEGFWLDTLVNLTSQAHKNHALLKKILRKVWRNDGQIYITPPILCSSGIGTEKVGTVHVITLLNFIEKNSDYFFELKVHQSNIARLRPCLLFWDSQHRSRFDCKLFDNCLFDKYRQYI